MSRATGGEGRSGQAPDGRARGGRGGDDRGDPPGLPSRAVRVFLAPGELFEALDRKPAWLDALLLATALSLATTLLIPEELVRETMLRQVPEGGDAAAAREMAGFVRTAGIVAAVVGPAIVTALIAAVTYLIFSLVLGGRSTYRKLFSAAAHVMLIPSLGALATVPLVLATGDVQTSLALHLLAPGLDAESYLFRFLRGLNVFGLAGTAAMGVAVGTLYEEHSTGTSAAVLLVLYVALKAALAIFGGP